MKINRPSFYLITISLLFAFAACSTTPKVKHETNPDVSTIDYATFALLPLPDSIPGADPGTLLRYGKTAINSLRTTLIAKGYTEESLVEADFAVVVKAQIVPKVDVSDYGLDYGAYYGRYGRRGMPYATMGTSSVDVDSYDEGTLIIEIYDTETKELAWVGWTSSRIRSKKMTDEQLQALISQVLVAFPSKYREPAIEATP